MKTSQNIASRGETLDTSGGNGGQFEYRMRRIGPDLGMEKLACSLYCVPPGKRAFPYHAHSVIEEMFVITQGEGILRHENEEFPICQGDIISAPVGEAHQIINTSDSDLCYMAISTNEPSDVVVYPDSNKVLAYSRAFGQTLWHISRKEDARDYFDGEDEPPS